MADHFNKPITSIGGTEAAKASDSSYEINIIQELLADQQVTIAKLRARLYSVLPAVPEATDNQEPSYPAHIYSVTNAISSNNTALGNLLADVLI